MNHSFSLKSSHHLSLIPQSIVSHEGMEFGLRIEESARQLVILAEKGEPQLAFSKATALILRVVRFYKRRFHRPTQEL